MQMKKLVNSYALALILSKDTQIMESKCLYMSAHLSKEYYFVT